jgi:NAD(P)-dependent dehydrogenase (short-subunit alcohol dehydrogenase family)
MTTLSGKTALVTDRYGPRLHAEPASVEARCPAGDIGDAIAFLASDAARWIARDTLRVDGGSKL